MEVLHSLNELELGLFGAFGIITKSYPNGPFFVPM